MNSIPVYRKGSWIHYEIPSEVRHIWSQGLKLQAASVYASAVQQGHSPLLSCTLAECYVNKELYEGLCYDKKIEGMLKGLLV